MSNGDGVHASPATPSTVESPSENGPFRFLHLPREIRDQILGEVFFPGEKKPTSQDNLGLATTAVRQIFPYTDDRDNGPSKFDVSIIRTCKQLQHEAEAILYGTSSWNLMYRDWESTLPKLSFECFQRLPKRLRKYVQRVERKCYSVYYQETISLFDWTVFMTFLARECPNLHTLKLWGPGDHSEAPGWIESCQRNAQWVQAILQIQSLRYFDIPVIRGGIIYDDATFRNDFLPWLKTSLLIETREKGAATGRISALDTDKSGHFPFLSLDRKVRDLIYSEVLIPKNRHIHPYINPWWFDQATRNVIPVFLTSKQIHEEAEETLYRQALFCSPIPKYDRALNDFVKEHSPQIRTGPLGGPAEPINYQRSYDGRLGNMYAT